YTPLNEPLTTARFSGLYGLWYPHARDERTFASCVIKQCRGVVLAMRAIRQVNSQAALIQTDDLGKTYSSSHLAYQADYENERRWLTWDLLTGELEEMGPIQADLMRAGITAEEFAAFRTNPCPPDIIGVNHYITSERFLDGDLEAHPPETHGGNAFERYADVAAVRAWPERLSGAEGVLREAWERYRLPLAITEAHIGCTREEQLRWFMEVWRGAEKLHAEGVDVRAVTVWSLLGAFDWNSLLTRQEDFYEPGAFDLRAGDLRPTAIAEMVRELVHRGTYDHPTLDTPGWWRRHVRLLATEIETDVAGAGRDELLGNISLRDAQKADETDREPAARPIMITGAAGRVAQGFIRAAELRGLAYRLFSRAELDITDEIAVADVLRSCSPWAVINCAGFSRVDAAEADEEACMAANALGAATLAALCAQAGIAFVTFSSDHVFDGGKEEPYVESDEPSPLNVYGESKFLAERQVLAAHPAALVVRPGEVFAPLEIDDFLRNHLRALARGERVWVENDIRFSGAYLPDLVHATLDLLIDGERGVWHLSNPGTVTPHEFLRTVAEVAHLDGERVDGAPIWRLHRPALRARNRALESERGQLLPPLRDAIQRYCRETPRFDIEAEELVAAF
ncbi:MAG: sugar nucleotide-binding protein, partial [Verrucomicrobiota bacterium]|nr:sugar nucleotide-binding protein [Verrucomicrobiota bacterium]